MFAKKKNYLVFGGLLVAVTAMMLVVILKDSSSGKKNQTNTTANASSQNAVIAKVGAETLYQKDFEREKKAYPKLPNTNIKEILIKKMIKDSKILQAAEKEKLIALDTSVYNSPDKDYQKRIKKIVEVEKLVGQRQEKIKGSVISIWCYNNSKPNTLDAAEAKERAFNKISIVYNAVKNKQMTMQQAAAQIQNDESLLELDIAYKANAILEFDAGPEDQITFDKTFESQVRQLQQGQISEIYLAKDIDIKTRELRDAVYMFAYVEQRTTTGVTEDFAAWYTQKEKDYAVQMY